MAFSPRYIIKGPARETRSGTEITWAFMYIPFALLWAGCDGTKLGEARERMGRERDFGLGKGEGKS